MRRLALLSEQDLGGELVLKVWMTANWYRWSGICVWCSSAILCSSECANETAYVIFNACSIVFCIDVLLVSVILCVCVCVCVRLWFCFNKDACIFFFSSKEKGSEVLLVSPDVYLFGSS